MAKIGRPTDYNPKIAENILRALAAGKTLTSICSAEGMPNRTTVAVDWTARQPDFNIAYARARQQGYEVLADELRDICDTPQIGTKTVQKPNGTETHTADMIEHRKLQVDTRKWFLSKLVPKIYGAKETIEHQGTITLSERLIRARKSAG